MKKFTLSILALFFLAVACSRVPITERRQLRLLPETQLAGMGVDAYQDFLRQNTVVTGTQQAQMVTRVGNRIAEATTTFMRENNMADRLQNFQWQFSLIQDNTANAWAMPGGKIAIYTGILPITATEAGLATVMGHEVAHVIARHGNERMSQALAAQLGGMALDVALRERSQETRNLFLAAYGVGAQVGVLLPHSRTQESEADRLGLIFMAMAGYNPSEAIGFWERMHQAHQGQAAPPEFLSTHPSHATRIQRIRNTYLPEAMRYYRPQN